jgi:hypothetical protein
LKDISRAFCDRVNLPQSGPDQDNPLDVCHLPGLRMSYLGLPAPDSVPGSVTDDADDPVKGEDAEEGEGVSDDAVEAEPPNEGACARSVVGG